MRAGDGDTQIDRAVNFIAFGDGSFLVSLDAAGTGGNFGWMQSLGGACSDFGGDTSADLSL